MEKIANKGKSALGVILLIVGLFLLGGNLGIIPNDIYNIFHRWPSILLLIGIFQLIRKDISSGLITLTFGIVLLMAFASDSFHFRDVIKFWPAVLIVAGISFIFRKKSFAQRKWLHKGVADDVLDVVSIFGGGVTKINSSNFLGGEITCIFGGEEVNLQSASLAEEGAVIELTTIFGGSKITVPRNWNVKVDVVSIFGGFSDKRMYEPETGSEKKTLVIKGIAVFGGGELRNF
ncbi:LiaI-LiaF-like domain-containing protein [Plebeiibacterium marinum]|uniref:Cell wall-active antibiotics response protein n=1 Tax=Plebeiibacterium marinum TaxID=2992111 RepID=A0AAE3MCS9_9BACT|nr:DUF5668 domain-containing protein [Plebeiobacterium marinum]MCW3805264.1 cell wall-active antibiotics response protein [Plebeiobacterium marinum]